MKRATVNGLVFNSSIVYLLSDIDFGTLMKITLQSQMQVVIKVNVTLNYILVK